MSAQPIRKHPNQSTKKTSRFHAILLKELEEARKNSKELKVERTGTQKNRETALQVMIK